MIPFAVFSGPDVYEGGFTLINVIIVGILVPLLPLITGILFKLIKWQREVITAQNDLKTWHKEVTAQFKAQEMKQHWMEIMIITIMEILISDDKSKEHAIKLLEDFKKRYPNPKMNNLSVCKCYTYALLRSKGTVKPKWQPQK